MANTLRFKRGLVSGIPTAALGEPLFTTDTFDLYIGNGTGNTRFQKYIASGATTQILRGDGSLYTFPLAISSPSAGQVLKYNGTSWVNDSDAGITGSGSAGQVAYFTGATTQGGSNNLFWDATNNRLGIGLTAPRVRVHALLNGNASNGFTGSTIIGQNSSSGNSSYLTLVGGFDADAGIVFTDESVGYRGRIVYSNNNEFMSFWTDLSERMRIHATGNLSLNSTTDNGLRFQVTGDGYFSGSVGIGTSGVTSASLTLQKVLSGTNLIGIYNLGQIQSTNGNSSYYQSEASTSATAITVTNLRHFFATTSSFGAGSAVTNQFGFSVQSSMVGATNNYGFFGDIAAGTGRWNLYMNGTAANYLAGNLAVGTTTTTNKLEVWGSGNTAARIVGQSAGNATLILSSGGVTAYSIKSGNGDSSLRIDQDGTERIMLASGGNLLIGTTTNSTYKLDVNGTTQIRSNLFLGVDSSSNSRIYLFNASNTSRGEIYFDGNNSLRIESTYGGSGTYRPMTFWTGATERMRLDASGNLGLAVTPSAWSSQFRAMHFLGNGASISGRTDVAAINVNSNWYWDGSNSRYIVNGFASTYRQYLGAHEWSTAPSGTAGNAITFTQAMTLDASGNLGLGVTPSAWSSGQAAIQGSGWAITQTGVNNTYYIQNATYNGTNWLYRNSFAASFYLQQAGSHQFWYAPVGTAGNVVSWTQGMTLFATGNFTVGNNVDAGFRLDVNGTMRVSGASTFNSTITIARGTDANVTNVNINSGVTPVSAFQLNTDQPNLRSILMARNGYSLVLGTQDVNRVTIDTTGAATFSSSVTCASLVVDSTTLVVDATNNRVGVNTNVPTSSLHVVGSVTKSHTTKTANYTMTESDYTVLCDTSAGGFTISLPAASGCSGRIYVIKKITGNSGTNNITIDPNGSETIDGATTYALQCRSSVMIQSNGANWWILAERVDNSCI